MRRITALALLLPLAACGERVIELSGDTMGTKYHVRIVGGAEAAARARVAIDELLAATDARFSPPMKPQSLVTGRIVGS